MITLIAINRVEENYVSICMLQRYGALGLCYLSKTPKAIFCSSIIYKMLC